MSLMVYFLDTNFHFSFIISPPNLLMISKDLFLNKDFFQYQKVLYPQEDSSNLQLLNAHSTIQVHIQTMYLVLLNQYHFKLLWVDLPIKKFPNDNLRSLKLEQIQHLA